MALPPGYQQGAFPPQVQQRAAAPQAGYQQFQMGQAPGMPTMMGMPPQQVGAGARPGMPGMQMMPPAPVAPQASPRGQQVTAQAAAQAYVGPRGNVRPD